MSAPVQPQAALGGEWRHDVQHFAHRLVETGLVPGMGVAVTQGDWVIYSGGFGIVDAATGRGVGEGTAFYIASSTKAMTATAVLRLVGRGKLEFDAPVTRYLPGLRAASAFDPRSVTLQSLLTMNTE